MALTYGRKRLGEIREAVRAGKFGSWLELVFMPLYGKYSGRARSLFVEEVLRFQSDLCKAGKISPRLFAAALIMSDKFIDKERLEALWEEIRMLDIIEIAMEKGMKKGKEESKRDMVIEALIERFDLVPAYVSEQIRAIRNPDILKALFRQAVRCGSLEEFEAAVKKAA